MVFKATASCLRMRQASGKTTAEQYAGLDVVLELASVLIVDGAGQIEGRQRSEANLGR
jgi:hypothetical protein